MPYRNVTAHLARLWSRTKKALAPHRIQHEDVSLRDCRLSGWFRHETGELLEGFAIDAHDVVLDVGCGNGTFAQFAAEQGAELIIADIDADKIAAAKAKLSGSRARAVSALVTDAVPLPLPDAIASKVVAMEVLEHVDDPQAVVDELYRVAKPGALFLVSVPAQFSEEIQKLLAPAEAFQRPNHIRIFKGDELEELLCKAGLVIERKVAYGFFWSMWFHFFWVCNQDISDPWHPLLRSWEKTWGLLLQTPQGIKTKNVLDARMPKSQAIIARKPLDHASPNP
jgi:SAM-dependent methyltransferase